MDVAPGEIGEVINACMAAHDTLPRSITARPGQEETVAFVGGGGGVVEFGVGGEELVGVVVGGEQGLEGAGADGFGVVLWRRRLPGQRAQRCRLAQVCKMLQVVRPGSVEEVEPDATFWFWSRRQ